MTVVRVACAQVALTVGDLEGNRRLVREAIREAMAAEARVIVLPELVTSGDVFESVPERGRVPSLPTARPSAVGRRKRRAETRS